MILSGNSIEHGLLALAATYAGIPYAPIAPAYSLAVKEFTALSYVWQNFGPAMVFADEGMLFAPALKAVSRGDTEIVFHNSRPEGMRSISMKELESSEPSPAVDDANRRTEPDSVAKILYTSGSTGLPKGVITTHRMLCSNQEMLRQMMPCLSDEPPLLCDWLPWNHTFGGSHNFGIAPYNGGSLFIDACRPTPDLFGETLRSLREVAPTAYFNVPKGYEMLVGHLRTDPSLRKTFFSRLNLFFFAAAGLIQHIWDALQDLAFETCGEEILVVTGLGATESAPYALSTGKEGASSRCLGLPAPGVELKLVPVEEKLEARLRGPSITRGFWHRPELTAAAFDEENYYGLGDAIKFADPKKRQGRTTDYIEISLESEWAYNPLHNDLDGYALAYGIASLLNNLLGKGKEPFWQQAYTNFVKFIIILHKVGFGYVTLFDVYECAISPEILERKIQEAEDRITGKHFVVIS